MMLEKFRLFLLLLLFLFFVVFVVLATTYWKWSAIFVRAFYMHAFIIIIIIYIYVLNDSLRINKDNKKKYYLRSALASSYSEPLTRHYFCCYFILDGCLNDTNFCFSFALAEAAEKRFRKLYAISFVSDATAPLLLLPLSLPLSSSRSLRSDDSRRLSIAWFCFYCTCRVHVASTDRQQKQ